MERMEVRNMTSKTGRPVANQFLIFDGSNYYLQSYNTVVAKASRTGKITLIKNACSISNTTNKYLYRFLQKFSSIDKELINKRGVTQLVKCGVITEVSELILLLHSYGRGFIQHEKIMKKS